MDKTKISGFMKSKLFHNSAWLYTLQIFNTVVPLITLPYITRVLGASGYGTFSYALNIIGYFQVIVNYGFDLTGSRKIAMARNTSEISKTFSSITGTKLVLFFTSLLTFGIFLLFIPVSGDVAITTMLLFIMLLGESIQPTWLFQGLQEMKFITLVSVFTRLLSIMLIFMFIKEPGDIFVYTIIYAIIYLLNGFISLQVVNNKFKIRFLKIGKQDIWHEIKDGWQIFSTSFASKIFAGIGITILGLSSSTEIVGIYSAIYKIPTLIIMAYTPFGQVLFPFISKKFDESFGNGLAIVKKIGSFITLMLLMLVGVVIFYSTPIVELLYGSEYSQYATVTIPLLIWSVLGILNNLMGIQVLVASGHKESYAKIFQMIIFINISLNVGLGFWLGMYGVAFAALISETLLTILLFFKINNIKHRNP